MSNIIDESDLLEGGQNVISQFAITQLQTTIKWTKFMGILGGIGSVLGAVILAFVLIIATPSLIEAFPMVSPATIIGFFISGVILMVIYAYAFYLLVAYSSGLKKYTVSLNMADYGIALVIWNRYWLISTITTGIAVLSSLIFLFIATPAK